jgi:hypothetical protein
MSRVLRRRALRPARWPRVVVQAVGGRVPLRQLPVAGEACRLTVPAIEPAAPVRLGVVGGFEMVGPGRHRRDLGAAAGHRYTPSGSSFISGWPHSHGCRPAAAGSTAIW